MNKPFLKRRFCYLLCDMVRPLGATGLLRVKIGITDNPVQRLKSFKHANPDYDFLHCWYCRSWAALLEKTLHKKFAKHRIGGEWFDLPEDVLWELMFLSVDQIVYGWSSMPANDYEI